MTPGLPFNWHDYLKLAEELAGRDGEQYLRTSIGRAYYRVYNLARERAERNGFEFLAHEAKHAQLWRLYSKNPDPECVKLSQIGLRMQKTREQADYDLIFQRVHENAQQSLTNANDFVARLNRLAVRHPSPQSIRQ
jgi:uncharacterized protein (UPF0332 family)